jgi:hypothetical protein
MRVASEGNPLVERVDALLRRHKAAAPGGEDLPVLTEIVDPRSPVGAAALDTAAVEALAPPSASCCRRPTSPARCTWATRSTRPSWTR